MRLRRLLALALVAGAFSCAFAAPLPVQAAVDRTVQGLTYDEVLQWSNSQFAKQATFGRYVRWGGAIILGSALIYTALNYFYETLKQQTGTSLDQWYYWTYTDWRLAVKDVQCELKEFWYGTFYRVHVYTYVYHHYDNVDDFYKDEKSCPQDKLAYAKAYHPLSQGYSWVDGVNIKLSTGQVVPVLTAQIRGNPRPSLPEWIQSHPDAAEGVKTAVGKYVQNTPPGSRSNPYPGVRLDPEPNPNQWTDNPYTDLGTDTDGDGWPDWMEKQVPWPDGINDPNSHPDPNRDDDGDGYSNQEEKQAGSDPYDPKSKPGTNPRTDTDGDGYLDDQELRCGSNPNDPASKCTNEQPKGDDLSWPGAPGTPSLPGLQKPNDPALPQFQTPQLEQTPWDQAMQSMRESIEQLKQQAMDKFPFAVVRWLRTPSTSDSGGCPAPQLTIGQWSATVNICGNPVWEAATRLRPFMLGGLLLTFGFTIVRRGLDVQR